MKELFEKRFNRLDAYSSIFVGIFIDRLIETDFPAMLLAITLALVFIIISAYGQAKYDL